MGLRDGPRNPSCPLSGHRCCKQLRVVTFQGPPTQTIRPAEKLRGQLEQRGGLRVEGPWVLEVLGTYRTSPKKRQRGGTALVSLLIRGSVSRGGGSGGGSGTPLRGWAPLAGKIPSLLMGCGGWPSRRRDGLGVPIGGFAFFLFAGPHRFVLGLSLFGVPISD